MGTRGSAGEEAIGAAAELATVVISLGNEPGLVDSVRSLLDQGPGAELMVVNSGGGGAGAALAAAGVEVEVIERPEPLSPGAARNLGIRATRAPFVAFLAADCLAEPGWISGRLRRHRAGADAVASAVTNATPASASAAIGHLLMYHRRMPSTPAAMQRHYGVSYSRPLLEGLGLFREDLRQGEDTELNGRLGRGVSVEWAPEVRTAHRSPAGTRQLLRDQYARGRRSLLYRHLPIRTMLRIALVKRPLDAFRQAVRTPEPGGRRRLLGASPLLAPASVAYALGLVRGRLDPSRRGAVPALSGAER